MFFELLLAGRQRQDYASIKELAAAVKDLERRLAAVEEALRKPADGRFDHDWNSE